jgi:hypothetical protein
MIENEGKEENKNFILRLGEEKSRIRELNNHKDVNTKKFDEKANKSYEEKFHSQKDVWDDKEVELNEEKHIIEKK